MVPELSSPVMAIETVLTDDNFYAKALHRNAVYFSRAEITLRCFEIYHLYRRNMEVSYHICNSGNGQSGGPPP